MVDKKIIKAELIKRGMTYNDLAKKLGISVSTLGNKMNSRSAFTIDELAIIADTFNKEITFFLNISVIKWQRKEELNMNMFTVTYLFSYKTNKQSYRKTITVFARDIERAIEKVKDHAKTNRTEVVGILSWT